MRWTPRAIFAVAAGIGIDLACAPISLPPGPPAPINDCSAHACSAYRQPGGAPACNAGVCAVSTGMKDLVLVIALPTDAFVAPGRTYVTSFSIAPSSMTQSCDSDDAGVLAGAGPCDPPECSPPCCVLPRFVKDGSRYVVSPDDAAKVAWNVGNASPPNPMNTSLPVDATYRRLWGATEDDAVDAVSLGLPLSPVPGILTNLGGGNPPGPFGAAPIGSEAYLQPGCYERTLQPYAPLSRAFPPDIHTFPPSTNDVISAFDSTSLMTAMASLPKFQITRANGLDGWTAYLRNHGTRRIFSNVADMSGAYASVTLATSHVSSTVTDALTGLELVIAPPSGTPLPAYVAGLTGPLGSQVIVANEPYPLLPTPVTMSGRIMTLGGTPVEADIVFTATDITDLTGAPFPSTSFEFIARAHASPNPKTGTSDYSVLLPRGHYQIVVLPRDASNALTAVSRRVDGKGDTMSGEDVVVGSLSAIDGRALVADGRPLAEAIVEVVPTACSADLGTAIAPDPQAPCMPRPEQTTTATDGSFTLGVDPGGYLLRVRPAEGSRLPWVKQPIEVGLGSVTLPPVLVPAPVRVSMTLVVPTGAGMGACSGNCVGNAVVRVFTDPSSGPPAIELGQAITDTSGHFEMYLAPPAQ